MIRRFLSSKIAQFLKSKSVLLLGPRQTGKSTLLRSLAPEIEIDLSRQSDYLAHLKNPSLLEDLVRPLSLKKEPHLILIDEIQRIPDLLHTVQHLIDRKKGIRFMLSGSSARKLKRGQANLLPGRIIFERMRPLTVFEILDDNHNFDLSRGLQTGLLPEVYLSDLREEILHSYTEVYLKEEIQAEGITKDLSSYARFLELAAEVSGQFINYSKLASDSEIQKDKIRRYFQILEDTLLLDRIQCFGEVDRSRKARQKDKFYLFDVGVRNAILGKERSKFTYKEKGPLFEHLIFHQLKAIESYCRPTWKLRTYRDDRGLEIDFILESKKKLSLLEVKLSNQYKQEFSKNLLVFEALLKENKRIKKRVEKVILYTGERELETKEGVKVVPYQAYLSNLVGNFSI